MSNPETVSTPTTPATYAAASAARSAKVHALAPDGTALCGAREPRPMPGAPFAPGASDSCPRCTARATGAPAPEPRKRKERALRLVGPDGAAPEPNPEPTTEPNPEPTAEPAEEQPVSKSAKRAKRAPKASKRAPRPKGEPRAARASKVAPAPRTPVKLKRVRPVQGETVAACVARIRDAQDRATLAQRGAAAAVIAAAVEHGCNPNSARGAWVRLLNPASGTPANPGYTPREGTARAAALAAEQRASKRAASKGAKGAKGATKGAKGAGAKGATKAPRKRAARSTSSKAKAPAAATV